MSRTRQTNPLLIYGLVALSMQLAGCVNTLTPKLDAGFGDAVRAARKSQTLNPEAASSNDPVLGTDGKSAVSAITNYQAQDKAPIPSGVFVNIGGSGK